MTARRSVFTSDVILGAISLLSDETWDIIAHTSLFGCGVALLIIETRSNGISRRDSACTALALIVMAVGVMLLPDSHAF